MLSYDLPGCSVGVVLHVCVFVCICFAFLLFFFLGGGGVVRVVFFVLAWFWFWKVRASQQPNPSFCCLLFVLFCVGCCCCGCWGCDRPTRQPTKKKTQRKTCFLSLSFCPSLYIFSSAFLLLFFFIFFLSFSFLAFFSSNAKKALFNKVVFILLTKKHKMLASATLYFDGCFCLKVNHKAPLWGANTLISTEQAPGGSQVTTKKKW